MSPRPAPPKDDFTFKLKALGRKALYIALGPFRLFKVVCFIVGLMTILVSFGVGGYAYSFFKTLPDLEHHDFTRLKAQAQRQVARKVENRRRPMHWTSLREINRDYLYAIVMSEDSSFFEHEGINFDAIVNSFIHNLRKKKYEYGASTISQQVAKNLFLSEEKSLGRKLKEVLITLDLEKYFTKNEVLEIYLNVAEFGPDIYGVAEAAEHYFRKQPADINAAEGAFIALMLPSPRKLHYAVFENQNITYAKRKKIRRILGDMLANEFISPKQYREYLRYDYFSRINPNTRREPGSRRRGS